MSNAIVQTSSDDPIVTFELDPAVVAGMHSFCAGLKQMREGCQKALEIAAYRAEKGLVGDMAYIVHLIDKDSDGANAKAVVYWINHFTKCQVTYNREGKKHEVAIIDTKNTRIDEGKEKVWWKCAKGSADLTGWGAEAAVDNLISQHSKKAKERQTLLDAGHKSKAELIELDSDLMRAIKAVRTNQALRELVLAEQQKLVS